MTEPARLSVEQRDGRTVMAFAGRLDAASIGSLWRPAMRAAERARGKPLAFELGAVSFSDVAGASFLAAASKIRSRSRMVAWMAALPAMRVTREEYEPRSTGVRSVSAGCTRTSMGWMPSTSATR